MTTASVEQASQFELRLSSLEEQMKLILGTQGTANDWQSTLGMWRDDEVSREADRLGEEWRKRDRE